MRRGWHLLLAALSASCCALAAEVASVDVPSPSMNRMVRCLVVLPDAYAAGVAHSYLEIRGRDAESSRHSMRFCLDQLDLAARFVSEHVPKEE